MLRNTPQRYGISLREEGSGERMGAGLGTAESARGDAEASRKCRLTNPNGGRGPAKRAELSHRRPRSKSNALRRRLASPVSYDQS